MAKGKLVPVHVMKVRVTVEGLAPLIPFSALLMKASGQLQVAVAVSWRKEPLVCNKYQVWWGPEAMWTFREKICNRQSGH